MSEQYIVTRIDKASVVEFRTASLMDPLVLATVEKDLERLVDEEDRRILVLDFTNVQFVSSQAIGIVISLHKKLAALSRSKFLLCGLNQKLIELMKITRLDKVLTVKPSQKEAINSLAMV